MAERERRVEPAVATPPPRARTTAPEPAPAPAPATERYDLGEIQLLHGAAPSQTAQLGAVVQRAATAVRGAATPPAADVAGGQALPGALRGRFEAALGEDLSGVRVHTDTASEQSAAALGARAWTVGRDVHFGAGEYRPGTPAGDRLIAHETVHTVQQRGAAANTAAAPQAQLAISRPGDAAEREAERLAQPLAEGGGAQRVMERPVVSRRPAAVMRDLLAAVPEAERQQIRVDTTAVSMRSDAYFQRGVVVPEGYTWSHEGPYATREELRDGLRAMAASALNLQPIVAGAPPPAARHVVHFQTVDLSRTPAHGPADARFRFTAHGTSVLIEDQAAPAAVPPISGDLAAQYGFTQRGAFFGRLWDRVLAALARIPDGMLRQIQDTPFEERAGDGPGGRAAEYHHERDARGTWTRVIRIYRGAAEARPDDFEETLTHEVGHAISERQRETGGRRAQARHDDPAFRQAAARDGGLGRAITDYGATAWEEYFAEAYAQFVHHPDTLLQLRPNVHAYFTQLTQTLTGSAPGPAHPGARAPRDFLEGDAILDAP